MRVKWLQSVVVVSVLVLLIVPAMAQQGGGRGGMGGGGRGMGFGFGLTGEILSDILVLDAPRTEKVVAVMAKVQEENRAQMQQSMQGGDQLSQEERRAQMQKMREATTEKTKVALKDVLSEEEMKAIDPFLSRGRVAAMADVRALRLLELQADQRGQLQKATLAYVTELIALQPARQPGQGGGGQGQGPDPAIQAKREELKKGYTEKVDKILNADQKTAWTAKTTEIQAELDKAAAERRQQFQDRQGGQQ